jgi:hypothetical protein
MMMFLLNICLTNIGCLNTKERIITISAIPEPIEGDGVIYVATNEPIDVAIQGKDQLFKLKVAGYYLLHQSELKILVRAANKYAEIKKAKTYEEINKIIVRE